MTGFNSKRLASKDSLQQAIDTVDGVMHPSEKTQRAITALRTALRSALAQPAAPVSAVQAEPVAWRRPGKHFGYVYEDGITSFAFDSSATPLYTHAAAPVPAVPGWQPIETAPKDWGFTMFDVWRRGQRVADCWWGTPTYGAKIGGVVHQTGYDSDGPVYDYVDGATHWMPLPPAPGAAAVQSAARTIAAEQAEDEGLWFVATTATEAHLQAALRRLTAAVEGEAPVALTPLTERQIYELHEKSRLSTVRFARAIEAAHGIGDKT
jgi:hypothetical protein